MSIIFADAYALGSPPEDDFPLTHARILWDNAVRQGAIEGTPGTFGFPPSAAGNPLTFEGWIPSEMPAVWEVLWPEPRVINALGIAVHNLARLGVEVIFEVLPDMEADWEQKAAFVPLDNGPILVIGEREEVVGARIRLVGDYAPFIGAIFIGDTLDMMRPIYGGHAPQKLNRQTRIYGRRSESGQGLGFSVQQIGDSTQYAWDNLDPEWYREEFDPFVRYATRGQGYFFIAWRPARFPNDVSYGVMDGDPSPQNTGVRDMMSVSITVNGLGPTGRPA